MQMAQIVRLLVKVGLWNRLLQTGNVVFRVAFTLTSQLSWLAVKVD